MADEIKIPVTLPGGKQASMTLRDIAAAQKQVGDVGKQAGAKAEGGYDKATAKLRRYEQETKNLLYTVRKHGKATADQERQLKRYGTRMGVLRQRISAVDGGMSKATKGTDAFISSLVRMGGAVVGLTALKSVIMGIVEAYNKAIERRSEFTQTAASLNRSLAGVAAQFGITEDQARNLAGGIGSQAGAGKADIPNIGNMITAASSSGLIGDIDTEGQLAGDDQAKLVMLGRFAQRTGAFGQEDSITKLATKMMGRGPKTKEKLAAALAKMVATYRKSELSDWSDFVKGGQSGLSGLLSEGVGAETALSYYGSMAQMTKSGMSAGEVIRMIGEQLFTSDRLSGDIEGYWQLKENDPDKLFRVLMDKLTSGTPKQRNAMYEKLGIAPELRGRLSKTRGAEQSRAAILTAMRSSSGGDLERDLDTWSKSNRAQVQSGELEAEMLLADEGGEGVTEKMRTIAEAYREIQRKDAPVTMYVADLVLPRKWELENSFMAKIRQYAKEHDIDLPKDIRNIHVDLAGDKPIWTYEAPGNIPFAEAEFTTEHMMDKYPGLKKAYEGVTRTRVAPYTDRLEGIIAYDKYLPGVIPAEMVDSAKKKLAAINNTGTVNNYNGGTHFHNDGNSEQAGTPQTPAGVGY